MSCTNMLDVSSPEFSLLRKLTQCLAVLCSFPAFFPVSFLLQILMQDSVIGVVLCKRVKKKKKKLFSIKFTVWMISQAGNQMAVASSKFYS